MVDLKIARVGDPEDFVETRGFVPTPGEVMGDGGLQLRLGFRR